MSQVRCGGLTRSMPPASERGPMGSDGGPMRWAPVGWSRDVARLPEARTIFSESPRHLEASVDEVREKNEVPHLPRHQGPSSGARGW